MKESPETPDLAVVEEFSGHVWIQELPTGGSLRFQVAASGLVTFGTPEGTVETTASVPAPFRRAAEAIDDDLDRDALLAAADDPATVTVCGVATRNEGVDYDWGSLPPFVGTDVWSGANGRFLAPDAATAAIERLGLPTLPAVETERPAAHTDFSRFDDPGGLPPSVWRDGAAAGLLLRDKSGGRGVAWGPDRADSGATRERSAPELAAVYATDDRIERTAAALRDAGRPVTVETIRDRLVADLARESYAELFPDDEFVASLPAFRSAVAERVQRHQSTTE